MDLGSEFLQARLFEEGQFRLQRTALLQDDEIERHKTRLRLLRTHVSTAKSNWAILFDRLQNKSNSLTRTLRQFRADRSSTLSALSSAHHIEHTRISSRHIHKVADLRARLVRACTSPSKSSSSFEGDETFNEILHSISDGADEIVNLADERATERIRDANKMLHSLNIQTRIRRRRMEDLQNQIDALRSRIERRRSKTESVFANIDRQMSTLTESNEASHLCREFTLDQIHREVSESEEVLRLRERLRSAHEHLALVKQRGHQRQEASQESLEHAIARKSRYAASLDALEVDNLTTDLLSKALDGERQDAVRLREAVARLDGELAKLREENIRLFRSVTARKYEIKSLTVPRIASPSGPSFLDLDA
jgi:hypothetical protein